MRTKHALFILVIMSSLLISPGSQRSAGAVPHGDTQYVVFAWNDLGMHCLNPTYDKAVILPPYNTLWAQVVRRGNPPVIVTSGITVEYRVINNTYSYGKRSYGQFWDNMQALFGVSLPNDLGLNLVDPNVNNGLAGTMLAKGDHFQANGIPVTPVDDSGAWNPYQVAEITVKDSQGVVLAQTQTTIPTSDEINCEKCHGPDPFTDIIQLHDSMHGTSLATMTPFVCANPSCHGSPALGLPDPGPEHYLSEHVHAFHATVADPPECYDCHPGVESDCNRSNPHALPNVNCPSCHGDLGMVGESVDLGRTPWVVEPKCANCHADVPEVDTGDTLYRDAMGHGGMYCAGCHGSPHAQMPSRQESDNYQAMQYQPPEYEGRVKAIGSCGSCHLSSKGSTITSLTPVNANTWWNPMTTVTSGRRFSRGRFSKWHAGDAPAVETSCNICHTAVEGSVSDWPHSFGWKNR